MNYRPDIDGLRAVAVLAVLAFHFQVPGLGGGFVGVDVFFVISGYLIGRLLLDELARDGRVSLTRFYMRRFRRIAPAWMVLCAAVMVAGYLLLLPHDLRELGKTVVATTLFAANIQFYRSAGYFDGAAEEKPLLHMWSLAVEEQFYLVLPLLLVLLWRWRKVGPGLMLVSAASLVACVAMTRHDHPAAFFLLPFRGWELLTGVLLARGRVALTGGAAHLAAWAGAAMIAGSVVLMPTGAGFPGAVAVFPVAGAALLIASGGEDTPLRRLLTARVMVAVGLISYSLYLWHWPLIAFGRLVWGDEPPFGLRPALAAASFLLAFLSWRWVEQPLRSPTLVPARWLMGGVAGGSAALIALGMLPFLTAGLPARWSPVVLQYASASQDFIQDWSRCSTDSTGPLAGVELCALGPDGPPELLVWGDSHGRAMKEGLDLAAAEAGVPALLIWRAGCPPLFGVSKQETAATRAQDAACRAANDRILQALPQLPRRILLVARWSYYAEGAGAGRDRVNRITLMDDAGSADPYETAVARTLKLFADAGKEVHVMRQLPEIQDYASAVVARRLARGGDVAPQMIEVPRPRAEARAARAHAPFDAAAAAGAVGVIDGWPRLCDAESCGALQGGEVVYFDNNHVTNHGAMMLRDLFAPLLSRDAGVGS